MYKKFVPDFIWMRLRKVYHYLFCTYRYRVEVLGAQGVTEKLPLLAQSVWQTLISRKKILFYPDGPKKHHALYKALSYLGYHITTDPSKHCTIAIKWWKGTEGNPYPPDAPVLANKKKILGYKRVLNNECIDITKERVAKTFEEVFGYSLSVDPLSHKGPCVMKSNWNALHLGRIVECPITKSELKEGFVYERLINNEIEGDLVEDIRVPILGWHIPFVYVKHRMIEKRFVDRIFANTSATLRDVHDILSHDEMEKICLFGEKIKLDYCEIDVLRDKNDGRIYIVDANSTPSGPPSALAANDGRNAVLLLAECFQNAYK